MRHYRDTLKVSNRLNIEMKDGRTSVEGLHKIAQFL